MSLRTTQSYVTVLNRGSGGVRVNQVYATVLDKQVSVNPRLRVSQVYLSVLARPQSWLRTSQVYVTVLDKQPSPGLQVSQIYLTVLWRLPPFVPPLPIPNPEPEFMGAIADLLAAPKTFAADSRLAAWLAARAAIIDEDIPASHAVTDEVQTIAAAVSDAGTWTLTINLRNGVTFTTAAMAHDLNAAGIIAAIDTASPASIGDGHIVATGGPINADDVILTFSGASVAGTNHNLSTVVSSLTLTASPVADPAVTVTTPGQTTRPARAVLYRLGVVDATLPDQGSTTAPVAAANLLNVPPWVIRELAQECAFEDEENGVYDATVTALLGYTDQAPLVSD